MDVFNKFTTAGEIFVQLLYRKTTNCMDKIIYALQNKKEDLLVVDGCRMEQILHR